MAIAFVAAALAIHQGFGELAGVERHRKAY
jgi:hypothetical protein